MTIRGLKFVFKAAILSIAAAAGVFIINCTFGKTPSAKNSAFDVLPGSNDARIAYATAQLMENLQYSQQQFDRTISENFFDEYVGGMSGLDPRHENFLQSDIDEFAHYRTNLDVYTVGDRGRADLEPAYVIYERFKQRLTQHAAYVDELLKQNKLNFSADDRIEDRRDAPFPKNMAEAQKLWRDRLRYEFLQDKLDKEISAASAAYASTDWFTIPSQVFSQPNFLSKSNFTDIGMQLKKHYDSTLHMMTNWDSDSILSAYLNAMVHAYDPHSDYLNTAHAMDFSIGMSLSLFGIGAQLTEQDGYCTIDSLVPGGPAERSKQLHPHDKIVAVAQSNSPPENMVDVDLQKVVSKIRGSKGTQVRLTIVPSEDSSARRIVTLTREEIKLEDQRAKAKLIEFSNGGRTNRIGIVDVPSFYAPIGLPGNEDPATNYVSSDVTALVEKLKREGVSGIILDLRSDPGGSLEESVKFVGLFIKNGPVVKALSTDKTVNTYADTDTNLIYDGPLVVLANRFSASAAEIVAGALQDYGRAVIVGDTSTFGKGTVQQLTSLQPFVWPAPGATNDPGTLKITIRKFYRVSGASTQFKGVASDIVLPDVLNYSTDIGERALDNPLPWETNAPAQYQPVNLVQPYLRQLQLRSEARVATNQDFIYIRQDIDEFKKLQADKTATLNEQKALNERQKNAAKDKARNTERGARKIPDEKIYDITIANCRSNSLPEPEVLTATNYETVRYILNPETNSLAQISHSFGKAVSELSQTNGAFAELATNNPTHLNSEKPKIVNVAPVDPALEEGENILNDYISLLSSNKALIAN